MSDDDDEQGEDILRKFHQAIERTFGALNNFPLSFYNRSLSMGMFRGMFVNK